MVSGNWEDHHVEKTLHILHKAETNKHPRLKMLEEALAWGALAITGLANVVISLALIPFLVATPFHVTLLAVVLFGVSFGTLIDFVARDIDSLMGHHYLIVSAFLPIVATISIMVVANAVKKIAEVITPVDNFNPLLLVLVYVVSFSAPHFVYKIIEHYELEGVPFGRDD